MPEYQEFVPPQLFQSVLALSPDGATVAYSSNAGGRFDLWVAPVGGGPARQVTRLVDQAVRQIAWTPDGKGLVFTADRQGDEQYRIYRIGLSEDEPTEIAPGPTCQRILANAPFDDEGRYLAYAANDRDLTVQDLLVRTLADGSERRITPPPGVVFEPAGVSPDGRWLVAGGFRSNSEVSVHLIDLDDPEAEPVCVTAEHGTGLFEPGPWARNSSGFYLLTSAWGEFTAAAFYSLQGRVLVLVAQHEWDVEHVAAADGAVMWSVNEAGCSRLHLRRDGSVTIVPDIPPGMIGALAVAPEGDKAVMLMDTAVRPTEIAAWGPEAGFRYLTDTRPPALRAIRPVKPEMVTFSASDGRRIHALLYRPNGAGPYPVLLSIHGGPEAQERPTYMRSGLYQHLLDRGIAILAPNVAGSTGFGARHQKLIYRDWGGPDLDDLDQAVRYLQGRNDIDADRIAVMGGSYGGFAALSCLARLPHPWAAGVSICGPSNLLTLAQAAPPTWKTFVSIVLGDPETDAARLTERSPVTHADNIKAPLLVLQGARDPRVPRSESDQLVARLRERGVNVRYEVFPDEGHGFTNRDNELRAYGQIADFLCTYLLP